VVGAWDTDGYEFNASKAVLEDGRFLGLVLDQDNQKELSETRIDAWLEDIKPTLLA
jgi:flavodoxin I